MATAKLIDYLKRHYPAVQVLILTMISSSMILERLHELGVVGVIQKNHLHTEIERALKAIRGKRPYLSPQAPRASVVDSGLDTDQRLETLSLKEREVLRLFVAGKTVGDIALSLSRSPKTISAQKSRPCANLKSIMTGHYWLIAGAASVQLTHGGAYQDRLMGIGVRVY